jgi:hypothetical protein
VPACADGAVSEPYDSPVTNATFYINATTGGATFDDAQTACVESGGNLAAYLSLAEQLDVERRFITYGFFLPESHKVGVRGPEAPAGASSIGGQQGEGNEPCCLCSWHCTLQQRPQQALADCHVLLLGVPHAIKHIPRCPAAAPAVLLAGLPRQAAALGPH